MKKCGKIQEECWIRANVTQANLGCWAQLLFQPIAKKRKSAQNKPAQFFLPQACTARDPILPSQACLARDYCFPA